MLLAFSRDLRVVLLRLASRLQTLRWLRRHASGRARRRGARVAAGVRAAGQPAGHLADQVGDGGPGLPLPEPDDYKRVARLLDEKRVEREAVRRAAARAGWTTSCAAQGIAAEVQGRPKHIYSIWKKMRGKSLDFDAGVRRARAARDRAPTCATATRRWPGCTSASRRCPASSTTTSPGPSPTATSRCTPWCATTTAGRSRSRSAPRRCTSTPSTAWPRTGPTRRPARKGYAGVRRPASEYDAKIAGAAPAAGLGARPRRPRRRPAALFDDRIYVLHAAGRDRRAAAGRARRSTSPTACTPTWATAAAARGSTARWCR